MPVALAASAWPRGTLEMPARMISQKYAASNMTNAVIADGKAPIGRPIASGIRK